MIKKRLLTLSIGVLMMMASCGSPTPSSETPISSELPSSSEPLPSSSEPIPSSELPSSEEPSSETPSSELPSSEAPSSTIISSELPSSEEVVSSSEEPLPELDIKRVKNMKDDFIRGMDLSSVISLEDSGVKFYNERGNEEDLLKIFADNGVNYIRVRVWNDPYDASGKGYGGGNNDLEKAIRIGKRATEYGMKLLVDFHYSDFWADPAKQFVPKAWKDLSFSQKNQALYDFTKDSLNEFKNNNIDVGMVAIGNEITNSFCGEAIKTTNYYTLLSSGSRATREVFPSALVAVHYTNPNRGYTSMFASYLANNNVDYDVFGYSYYPHYHGTFENLTEQFNHVVDNYGKKVMVMETSYAYTIEETDFHPNSYFDRNSQAKDGYPISPLGQAKMYRDICDLMVNTIHNDKGIGVCYWEGAWITVGKSTWNQNSFLWEKYGSGWASSYSGEYDPDDAGKWYGGSAVDNQAFFDKTGKALISIQVFDKVLHGEEEIIEGIHAYVNNKEIEIVDSKPSGSSDRGKYEISLYKDEILTMVDGSTELLFYKAGSEPTSSYVATKNGTYTVWYNSSGELWVDEPSEDELVLYLTGTFVSWGFDEGYKLSASSDSNYQYELKNVSLKNGHKLKVASSDWKYEWTYNYYSLNGTKTTTTVVTGPAASLFSDAKDGHDNILISTAGNYNIYITSSNLLYFEKI